MIPPIYLEPICVLLDVAQIWVVRVKMSSSEQRADWRVMAGCHDTRARVIIFRKYWQAWVQVSVQIPRSQIQGKGTFGLWAVTKILGSGPVCNPVNETSPKSPGLVPIGYDESRYNIQTERVTGDIVILARGLKLDHGVLFGNKNYFQNGYFWVQKGSEILII